MFCFLLIILLLLLLFSSIYYCHHCLLIIKSGDGGHRSHCPFHAKEMLYHLSYIPIPFLSFSYRTSFNPCKHMCLVECGVTLFIPSILSLTDWLIDWLNVCLFVVFFCSFIYCIWSINEKSCVWLHSVVVVMINCYYHRREIYIVDLKYRNKSGLRC